MNKNILQKILTELGKENPSIDYLKGMVETLIEMGETPTQITPSHVPILTQTNTSKVDEEFVPAHLRVGPVGNNIG